MVIGYHVKVFKYVIFSEYICFHIIVVSYVYTVERESLPSIIKYSEYVLLKMLFPWSYLRMYANKNERSMIQKVVLTCLKIHDTKGGTHMLKYNITWINWVFKPLKYLALL